MVEPLETFWAKGLARFQTHHERTKLCRDKIVTGLCTAFLVPIVPTVIMPIVGIIIPIATGWFLRSVFLSLTVRI